MLKRSTFEARPTPSASTVASFRLPSSSYSLERARRTGRRRKLVRVNTLSSANTRGAESPPASRGFKVGGNSCLFRFTSGDESRRKIYIYIGGEKIHKLLASFLAQMTHPLCAPTSKPPIINVSSLLRQLLYTRFVGSQVHGRVDEPIKLIVYAPA